MIFLSLITLAFFGCGEGSSSSANNDENEQAQQVETCEFDTIVVNLNGTDYSFVFDSGKLTSLSAFSGYRRHESFLNYNEDGNLTEWTFGAYKEYFNYDKDNRLIEYSMRAGDEVHKLYYDGKGNIIKEDILHEGQMRFTNLFYEYIEGVPSNMKSISFLNDTPDTTHYDLQFDRNKNPFKGYGFMNNGPSIYHLTAVPLHFDHNLISYSANHKKGGHSDGRMFKSDTVIVETYDYTYNASRFPVSLKGEHLNITYDYKCK